MSDHGVNYGNYDGKGRSNGRYDDRSRDSRSGNDRYGRHNNNNDYGDDPRAEMYGAKVTNSYWKMRHGDES